MAPGKGTGKGVGNKVQNASALRAGQKNATPAATTRIANAKALRGQFAEVAHSPDGTDPSPLTMPKCVECSHCGWPVYPRDSRVATRKTFERAGIQRDYGEKEKEKKKEKKEEEKQEEEHEDLDLGDEEEEHDDAASEDTIGTVEMLETKVQEMEEKIIELESLNNSLEQENAELTQKVEDLEEALSAAEEKIELLEESEMRWREKNSVLRVENEELRLVIDRVSNRVGDLETDMVKKLLEIRGLKEKAARDERRRALMLQNMEREIRKLEGSGMVKALFKVWQEKTVKEKVRQEMQDAEERRRLEVAELGHQLAQEKQHILSLEATADRLRGNLKAAAQRMLMKVFSSTQKPWATGHAMKVWCGTHTALKFENELIATQAELEETQNNLKEEKELTTQLTTDLEEATSNLAHTTKERDELAGNYSTLMQELQSTLGSQNQHASDIQRMAEEKARKAREDLTTQVWAEANKKMDAMNKDFDVERLKFEDQIGGLEAQLESIKRGIGGSTDSTDETRVVPKGQGILCCGCLKQIVNRGVKQLPPVSMPTARSPSRKEEKAKKLFFDKELQGMPDADDLLHSEVWKARRDPLAGLRYAAVSPEVSWSPNGKSASLTKLTPLRIKETLKFQPRAFR